MNIDEKRLFIKLVAEGAQTKAYKRVGLTKFTIKDHLGRLAEYEKDVAEAEAGPSIPKKLRDIIKGQTLLSEVSDELVEEVKNLKGKSKSFRAPEPRREDSCDTDCSSGCDEGECDA